MFIRTSGIHPTRLKIIGEELYAIDFLWPESLTTSSLKHAELHSTGEDVVIMSKYCCLNTNCSELVVFFFWSWGCFHSFNETGLSASFSEMIGWSNHLHVSLQGGTICPNDATSYLATQCSNNCQNCCAEK